MIYEFNGDSPKIDPTAFVSESATIIGKVEIGKQCFVGPGAVIRGDVINGKIVIGDYSIVEDCVIVHGDVTIEERVTIGHGAIIHCKKLSRYSNVGMGAILSLSSEVGEHSVVAEGAVVKKGQIIPEKVVVGGTPARVLRKLEERDLEWWTRGNAWYVKLAEQYNDPKRFKRLD